MNNDKPPWSRSLLSRGAPSVKRNAGDVDRGCRATCASASARAVRKVSDHHYDVRYGE